MHLPTRRAPLALIAGAIGLTLIGAPLVTSAIAAQQPEEPRLLPVSTVKSAAAPGLQKVVFAGGCFWGVQGVFQHVTGVTKAVSGYDGGKKETAEYELVGTGTTGHAESVEVTYDPKKVSFEELLRIFFSVATDPTQLNMQYPDHGTQYRNVIFYNTPEQKKLAEAYIAQLSAAKAFKNPIVTKVQANSRFYPAEGYHQDYLFLHPGEPYIMINDLPKVRALKKYFPVYYRDQPLLVAAR
jgi:peptide-methionine (S)-S-oxide reductase